MRRSGRRAGAGLVTSGWPGQGGLTTSNRVTSGQMTTVLLVVKYVTVLLVVKYDRLVTSGWPGQGGLTTGNRVTSCQMTTVLLVVKYDRLVTSGRSGQEGLAPLEPVASIGNRNHCAVAGEPLRF